MSAPVIRIVAALIADQRGHVLLVRKRGTDAFMQPGGKYEPGENAREALVRELSEELGISASTTDLDYLGYFEADAANEAGHVVEAEVFRLALTGAMTPAGGLVPLAEIDELIWHDISNPGDITVAPLSADRIFPLL